MPVEAEIIVNIRPTAVHRYQRIIEINRITQQKNNHASTPELDEVNVYEVRLKNHPDAEPKRVALFDHMWGHDLLTLVSEAIDALGGPETETNRFRGKDAR